MKNRLQVFNYSFRNATETAADIFIDGDIVDEPTREFLHDWWGDTTSVSYKSLRQQVDKAAAKTYNVYINCNGGHVGDAMAIHDLFEELEGKGITINRIGRGIIASAGTYLLMGKNSSMTENSFFMIHNVSGGMWGDVNVMENYVAAMRKFNDKIRDFYANKTGLRKEEITKMMDKETWMTANEAKEKGFVSDVTNTATFTNSIKPEDWPFQDKGILNAYNSSITKNSDMDIKKIMEGVSTTVNTAMENLLNKLGIKKDDNKDADTAITDFGKAITDGLSEAMKPLENLEKTISDAVANAVKDQKIADTVKNEVTEATKGFVTNAEHEKLKNDVAAKLGNKATETETGKEETRVVKNKKDFFSVGTLGE